jgi:hypothetical protein
MNFRCRPLLVPSHDRLGVKAPMFRDESDGVDTQARTYLHKSRLRCQSQCDRADPRQINSPFGVLLKAASDEVSALNATRRLHLFLIRVGANIVPELIDLFVGQLALPRWHLVLAIAHRVFKARALVVL